MIRGILPATPTFFSADGSLCLSDLEAHLKFLAQEGVHGFVPCGTTGEASTISRDERNQVIELTVRIARENHLTVMAGCGGNNTDSVKELLAEAGRHEVDAALVVTPYYNKPTQRGLIAHYMALAESSPVPIVLYNIPGRTSVNLTLETIATLFQHPNIIGIKESTGLYSNWIGIAEKLDLEKKILLSGDDDAFAVMGAFGGKGLVSVAANAVPKKFLEIQDAIDKQDLKTAFEKQVALSPLVRSMFVETNPAPLKFALKVLHGRSDQMRLPLVTTTPETQKAVREALNEL